MKNKNNILDLSKNKTSKKSFFGFKKKKKFNSPPNLSFGVKVSSVKGSKKKKNKKAKVASGIRPRLINKKKIKGIRERDYDTVDSSQEISDIWKSSDNLNSSTFKKRNSKSKSLYIVIFLLFLLAGASVAGWYFFGTKELNGAGVNLEIKGDDNIISGEKIELSIKYKNKENVKVEDLELRINYPDGFYYISADPYAETLSSNVWHLDDLKSGETGEIKLIAQIIGEIGSEIVLEPVLSYEPANFSSYFESETTKVIKIDKTLMDMRVEAPNEIGNNNRVTYNIFYKNISDKALDNFRIKMDYPDNFTIIETDGDAKLLTENTWEIGELMKDEEDQINVTGFFDLENVSSSTVKAILEIKSSVNDIPLLGESSSDWYSYLEIEKTIALSELAASLKLSINADNKDSALDWGSELEYVISYKNTSDVDLENVIITSMLNSEYLDWETLDDNFSGALDEANKTITWDKKTIPSLAKLDIGQEGRISFKIKLQDFQEEFLNKENYLVSSKVLLNADNLNNIQEGELIDSNVIINKINSPLNFSVQARYYDDSGQAVGSGPLPPMVGETTSYQIVWNLKSLASDLNNVIIKTSLPPGVEWGQGLVSDDQDLIFNDTTRQVVWRISKLTKDTDSIAKFTVLITPQEDQVDKIITLNNTTSLVAEDGYSQGKINLNKNYLTTELEGDVKAQGNEKVINLGL